MKLLMIAFFGFFLLGCSLEANVQDIKIKKQGNKPSPLQGPKITDEGCAATVLANRALETEASQSVITFLKKGKVVFKKNIPLPDEDFFQNRAFHCLLSKDFIYVLDQVDTSAKQLDNQTLLYIVKFSKGGELVSRKLVSLPEWTDKSISAWVERDGENFILKDNGVLVKGQWLEKQSTSEVRDFSGLVEEE